VGEHHLHHSDAGGAASRDNSRLIVVQRAGTSRSVPINATSSSETTTFLTLSNVVRTSNGGFLSMAFHPNWATNRYAYVVYTTSNRMERLSRFQSTDGGATLDASTEQVVLQIQHAVEFNHNGGQVAFGLDGYLYMSSGDDAYLDYTRARQAALANNGICNVNPTLGDLGLPNAKLFSPGNFDASVVLLRMNQRGSSAAMPPLASTIVDAQGAALLSDWIDSLTSCPEP
jgi:hypothetical protein